MRRHDYAAFISAALLGALLPLLHPALATKQETKRNVVPISMGNFSEVTPAAGIAASPQPALPWLPTPFPGRASRCVSSSR